MSKPEDEQRNAMILIDRAYNNRHWAGKIKLMFKSPNWEEYINKLLDEMEAEAQRYDTPET